MVLLNKKVLNSGFYFHPKCGLLNLTSLVFAYDLFILSKIELTLIKVLNEALEEFRALSGLQPNLHKCEIFTSGFNRKMMG